MCIRDRVNGGPSGDNSDFIGIDEVMYGASCSGTPTPGSTISSVASVCPNVNFTLSLQNASGLGTNYQWQSSPDGTTWTNVTGATNATLITTQSTAKYYRASVSCGANTAFSTAVQVTMNPPLSCYCIPGLTNCGLGDIITKVVFGSTLNNSCLLYTSRCV